MNRSRRLRRMLLLVFTFALLAGVVPAAAATQPRPSRPVAAASELPWWWANYGWFAPYKPPPPPPPTTGLEVLETPLGTLEFDYELDDDGDAIFEGDIILDLESMRRRATNELATLGSVDNDADYGTVVSGLAATDEPDKLWPGGIVYYEIDEDSKDDWLDGYEDRIDQAIEDWQQDTPLRFVERVDEDDYVRFRRADDGCSSHVGRKTGRQDIKLADVCRVGNIRHEIGHAIGLFHEHTREDRDDYVDVKDENIQDGKHRQFKKYSEDRWLWWGSRSGVDLGAYDFDSIMHYAWNAFSKNGKATLERVQPCGPGQPAPTCEISGQRDALSNGDRRYIHELYCPTVGWDSVWPGEATVRCDGYLAPPADVYVNIVVDDPFTDQCVDVADASMSNGVAVNQYPCHDRDNQLWHLQADPDGSGSFYIKAKHSGLCLDVPSSSLGHVGLQQYPCNGGANQRFNMVADLSYHSNFTSRRHGLVSLRAVHSGLCLGIGSANRLVQTGCGTNSVRQFRIEVAEFARANVKLTASGSDLCIDVPASVGYEIQLQQYPCNDGANQKWRPIPAGDGAWVFQATHTGGDCLGVRNDRVVQRSCGTPFSRSSSVKFWLHMMGDGSFQLRQGWPRRCVDATTDGHSLLVGAGCFASASRWTFD